MLISEKKIVIIERESAGKNSSNGGEYVSGQIDNIVTNCFSDFQIKRIVIMKTNNFIKLRNIVCGKSYGYTYSVHKQIEKIFEEKPYAVFFNGSLYGTYVKEAKNRGIKTLVFYHNVESKYYFDWYTSNKTLPNLIMYKYAKNMEQLSTNCADMVIVLNERDSIGLNTTYGKSADIMLPISYDKISADKLRVKNTGHKLLFVGSNSYANINGIKHFINNVLPYINVKLRIIGSCCDSLRLEQYIADHEQIDLVGFVEDIDAEYINAAAVICPIYLGSGMKTKTVEALKYGKTVFGTTEAFEGIKCDYEQIGGLCNTDEEFIEKINSYSVADKSSFNEYAYMFFMSNFETKIVEKKFVQDIKSKLMIGD